MLEAAVTVTVALHSNLSAEHGELQVEPMAQHEGLDVLVGSTKQLEIGG